MFVRNNVRFSRWDSAIRLHLNSKEFYAFHFVGLFICHLPARWPSFSLVYLFNAIMYILYTIFTSSLHSLIMRSNILALPSHNLFFCVLSIIALVELFFKKYFVLLLKEIQFSFRIFLSHVQMQIL